MYNQRLRMPVLRLILFLAALASAAAQSGETLSVGQAFARTERGEIVLIDIRSPQEWQETGIASVARPISMYDRNFLLDVRSISAEAAGRPVAFICATGGRSAWLTQELSKRGIANLVDVPEGMLGSAAGPGWLRAGLPVRPYSPGSQRSPTYGLWERLTGAYRPPWIGTDDAFQRQ